MLRSHAILRIPEVVAFQIILHAHSLYQIILVTCLAGDSVGILYTALASILVQVWSM